MFPWNIGDLLIPFPLEKEIPREWYQLIDGVCLQVFIS